MKIALLQSDLIWENPEANRVYFEEKINGINEPVNLIVLPEMFSTGFTMNPEEHAQTMDGEALDWMKLASVNKMICGSLAIAENGQFYNRFLAVLNGEIVFQYNKKHLFSYGNENEHYTAGNDCGTFEYQGWQIAPFICYDLRFPEWIRNSAGADLMLFVANWPAARMKAWNTLLTARAIENQCYVLGVNRVGDDGNGIKHTGHSQLIDFSGDHRVEPIENREQLVHAVIEKSPMTQFRERFPFLKDRTV